MYVKIFQLFHNAAPFTNCDIQFEAKRFVLIYDCTDTKFLCHFEIKGKGVLEWLIKPWGLVPPPDFFPLVRVTSAFILTVTVCAFTFYF